MARQRVVTRLWPIGGLDLEPDFPGGDVYLGGDVPLGIGLLVGLTGNGTQVIEATSDGSLKVADTGSGLESYEVFAGTATDTLTALGVAAASSKVTIEVEAYDLSIAFVDSAGGVGDTIDLAVGVWEFDFTFHDLQVGNESSGSNSVYQVIAWR